MPRVSQSRVHLQPPALRWRGMGAWLVLVMLAMVLSGCTVSGGLPGMSPEQPTAETPHGLHFRDAAALFGLGYCNPATRQDFEAAFRAAFEADRAVIIEIKAERAGNAPLHRQLQSQIAAAVEKACTAEV